MNSISRPIIVLLATAAMGFAQQSAHPQVAHATSSHKPDMAAAYYHYALAHMYEEQIALYGRSDLVDKAISEYEAAIDADPSSEYLTAGLAQLYVRVGRIRDAVLEAQDIIAKDPSNLEAHKLLGRIYLQSLGDIQSGNGSQNVLKLAIEQYEEVVKLEPDSVDDHLLLGRLYRVDNDFQKAENEFKAAVKLDPTSEDAVTALALLYNDEGDTNRATQVLTSLPESARSAKLYSALGYTYEQQKMYKKAIDAYRHAVELDRDNLDAIRGLAQNLLNDGQTEAALEQYKIIADSNPEDAQTYLRMAEIYRRQGKFDLALDNLKKAGDMVPDSLEVPYNVAIVYEEQGRYDDAIQVLQDLLKKTEKPAGDYNQGEQNNRAVFLERLGDDYRESGNDQSAVDTFRKMSALGNDNAVRGQELIIDTYRSESRYDEAIQTIQDQLKKSEKPDGKYTTAEQSNRAAFLERLGDTYRDSGNNDEAIQTFRQMLTLGDDNAERGYEEIIDTYRGEKDWKKATDAAKEATEKLPKDRDLKMVYAGQIADMGQPEQGLAQVKALLNGTDQDRDVYLNLAQMYARLKRWPEAEQALDSADKLSKRDDEKEYVEFLRGADYERQKMYPQAEQTFRQILATDPENAATLNYLGYMMADRGENLEEALGYIKRAVQLDPSNGAYLDSLGWAYFKLGKYDLAEENLIKASQHNMGSDPTVQDHLGDLYQKTGRLKLAAAHWERALHEWSKTIAPEVDTEDVAKLQKKLESAKVKLAKEQIGENKQ
jgi:tetratricopeptide (TPR) repeat protein